MFNPVAGTLQRFNQNSNATTPQTPQTQSANAPQRPQWTQEPNPEESSEGMEWNKEARPESMAKGKRKSKKKGNETGKKVRSKSQREGKNAGKEVSSKKRSPRLKKDKSEKKHYSTGGFDIEHELTRQQGKKKQWKKKYKNFKKEASQYVNQLLDQKDQEALATIQQRDQEFQALWQQVPGKDRKRILMNYQQGQSIPHSTKKF